MANSAKWVLDPSHSEISFKVKHLMISNVKGQFTSFSGNIEGEDFTNAPISVSIATNSIHTNDEGRDGHLKSGDFFDAEAFPEITFSSTSVQVIDEDNFKLLGQLKIKGVSNPVTLDVEFGGIGTDPWGNQKAAFSVSGKIKRSDFGLNWNAALETGGVLVSDEVRLTADVQFVKQA